MERSNHAIEKLKLVIVRVLKKHGAVRAGLFGSVSRNEGTSTSDIDILVEFKGNKSLLDLVRVKYELEESLRREVDLLTYRSVHPLLKKKILAEEIKIL